MVGGVTTTWGTVLKGHNIRKVENHPLRWYYIQLQHTTMHQEHPKISINEALTSGFQANAQVILLGKVLAYRRSSANIYSVVKLKTQLSALTEEGFDASGKSQTQQLRNPQCMGIWVSVWAVQVLHLAQPRLQTLVCGQVGGGWGEVSCLSLKGRVVCG